MAKKSKAVEPTPAPEPNIEKIKNESTPEDIAQIPAPSEAKKADTVDADESVSGRSASEEEKVGRKASKIETIDKKDAPDDEEENHDDDPLKVVDSSRVVDELEPGEYTTVGFSKSLEPGTRVSRTESTFVVIQQTAERVNDKGKTYFDHLVMLERSGEDQKSAKKSLFKGNFELIQ